MVSKLPRIDSPYRGRKGWLSIDTWSDLFRLMLVVWQVLPLTMPVTVMKECKVFVSTSTVPTYQRYPGEDPLAHFLAHARFQPMFGLVKEHQSFQFVQPDLFRLAQSHFAWR